MNARWRKLAARLDALANRERVMVFFGGMAMIFLVLWVAAIEPVAKKVTSLRSRKRCGPSPRRRPNWKPSCAAIPTKRCCRGWPIWKRAWRMSTAPSAT